MQKSVFADKSITIVESEAKLVKGKSYDYTYLTIAVQNKLIIALSLILKMADEPVDKLRSSQEVLTALSDIFRGVLDWFILLYGKSTTLQYLNSIGVSDYMYNANFSSRILVYSVRKIIHLVSNLYDAEDCIVYNKRLSDYELDAIQNKELSIMSDVLENWFIVVNNIGIKEDVQSYIINSQSKGILSSFLSNNDNQNIKSDSTVIYP